MNETHNSTETGYRIEARTLAGYVMLHDGPLMTDWRRVAFETGNNPCGVPQMRFSMFDLFGLLPRNSAMALAWTLIAQHPFQFIEARLVPYRLETKCVCEAFGEPEVINQIKQLP